MSHHTYYGPRATLRALTGLDFGLRVRVNFQSRQRAMFPGAENPSARQLISELAQEISSLRVYSYALRGQLEQAISALQLNAAGARGATRVARRRISRICCWRRGASGWPIRRRAGTARRLLRGSRSCAAGRCADGPGGAAAGRTRERVSP